MNICIVAGARPNFVKVAPIVRAIKKMAAEGVDVSCNLIYTGTEDDSSLESMLFSDLQMDKPDAYLGLEPIISNEYMGEVMVRFEAFLASHPADVIMVVDDLISTMGVSIVAKRMGLILVHVVAGTRSFNFNVPKEINRMVIDGLSDILFTSGISNNSIANREGAELSKVYMVGNVLIDSLRYDQACFYRPKAMDELGLKEGDYIVFTLNRRELLTNKELLRNIIVAMCETAKIPVIAPLHPYVAGVFAAMELPDNFHVTSPFRYLEFGYLNAKAKGVVTDSGNVAEEATFNFVPCITLNDYVEHQETVVLGTNVLVGTDVEKLRDAVTDMVEGRWKKSSLPDRWDGHSAERIVQIILQQTIDSKHE